MHDLTLRLHHTVRDTNRKAQTLNIPLAGPRRNYKAVDTNVHQHVDLDTQVLCSRLYTLYTQTKTKTRNNPTAELRKSFQPAATEN